MMTLREKLADWISGGALSRALEAEVYWRDEWKDEMGSHAITGRYSMRRSSALRRIAAMETHGANATVRRMAKTAREALG